MLRNRILALYKTLTLRTQRNRVMPIADSLPIANWGSATWVNTGFVDLSFYFSPVQLTGVNKQITLQVSMTDSTPTPGQMSAVMYVQGQSSTTPSATAAAYPITPSAPATFNVNPGMYCLLLVMSSDVIAAETTTITITNKSPIPVVPPASTPNPTVASFTVNLSAPP